MEIFSDKPIVRPEHHEKYRNFKYNGKDDSLFYRYIVSDLCNEILKYTPEWIA